MYNLEEETLMKKYIKKLISIPPILAISISLLTACSVPQSESTPSPSEKSANETVYAFVGKDIQNPYNQKFLRVLKPLATKSALRRFTKHRLPQPLTNKLKL